jgi:tetratricopeptide (TPR) repeat protein
MGKSRIDTLKDILFKDPDDSFTQYALGLEYTAQNNIEEAVNIFESLMQKNPGYHALYYQLGKAYELTGDSEKARKIYEKGIYVTTSQNEIHAREELQQALDELL